MAKYVVLLRGINVGGHKCMPMKQLTSALEAAGLRDVQTLLQSGNVVLESSQRSAGAVEKRVHDSIASEFGYDVSVMARSARDFLAQARACPFEAEAQDDPKTVHYFSRRNATKIDSAALTKLRAPDERTKSNGKTFHLHAPSGIGRSKLVAHIDSVLGEATARNARTIGRLVDLLGDL